MGKEKKRKERKERKEKKKNLKLVTKFCLRHTLEICYGEENSEKKFRGGEKKSNFGKNILLCCTNLYSRAIKYL